MADAYYTESKIKAVIANAVAAANAHIKGKTTYSAGSGEKAQTFNLTTGGYCGRFVRQCFETGCQMSPSSWRYRGSSAIQMLAKLKANGHAVSGNDLQPGDILGHSRLPSGHIMLYVGEIGGVPTVAENTSAAGRGNPPKKGTKLTSLAEVDGTYDQVYRLHEKEEKTERSWNFVIIPDSTDIVARGMATTWTDSVTRSGIDASQDGLIACSIPRGLCDATSGSPFVGVPDYAIVRIYLPRTKKTVCAPIIDEGPGWSAQAGTGKPGSAMIDLTPAAWVALGGKANKNEEVLIRILKGTEGIGRDWAHHWR